LLEILITVGVACLATKHLACGRIFTVGDLASSSSVSVVADVVSCGVYRSPRANTRLRLGVKLYKTFSSAGFVAHTTIEALPVSAFAALACWQRLNLSLRATAVGLSLANAFAIFVHLSRGIH
jgi:hypothetical protein